jgi:hypothetical protein
MGVCMVGMVLALVGVGVFFLPARAGAGATAR